VESSADERELLGDDVVIRSPGKLRRDARSTVEFIEFTTALDEDEVLLIGSIMAATGASGFPGPGPWLELPAASKPLERAGRVRRIRVTQRGIDRIAVRGPAQLNHRGPVLCAVTQVADQSGRRAVIVIETRRLHMGVVLIQPKTVVG
jgi:hypothetical protein